MNSQPEISVVLPIFNELEIVGDCLAEVAKELQQGGISYEIICVDDGSWDGSEDVLDQEAQKDPRIIPVHFSRNFGKEAALSAGLEAAKGQAVLLLDADLQHPPSVITQMIQRWREGYDFVDAVKEHRGGGGLFYESMAWVFYALMARAIGNNVRNSSDFKLLDRQVVDAVRELPERHRFFRGLVVWVGFRGARVPFQVQKRRGGQTKWSSRQLIAYSVRNLVAFSSAPLRAVAYTGFATVGAAVLLAIYQLYHYYSGQSVSGFTTVILVMLALSGLILTSLGAIAIYTARIYDEQKGRPLFVIRRTRAAPEARGEATDSGAR
jgi:dolichol-phosphate mannosyltransferase